MTAITFYCWRSLQLVSVLVLTIIYQKNVLNPFFRLVPAASSYQRGNRPREGRCFQYLESSVVISVSPAPVRVFTIGIKCEFFLFRKERTSWEILQNQNPCYNLILFQLSCQVSSPVSGAIRIVELDS